MFDPAKVEKIGPDCWRHNQLSVARFSGSCKINGVSYILDSDTDHLVRSDIWQQEMKDKAKQNRWAAAEKKRWDAAAQVGLFEHRLSAKGTPF